jgi:hypothetical protein
MALLGFLPLLLAGLLFVWFLGLAAQWTLKLRVSLKLRWLYFGLLVVIAIINILVSQAIGRAGSVVLGLTAQVLFGAWFFGKFAVRGESQSANFVGGLKMVGVATALLIVLCVALFAVSSFMLARTSGG